MRYVIAISGPVAVGKSALAGELVRRFGAYVSEVAKQIAFSSSRSPGLQTPPYVRAALTKQPRSRSLRSMMIFRIG